MRRKSLKPPPLQPPRPALANGLFHEYGETPAMAAEARRETRQGAEGDEEGDGGDGVHDSERVGLQLIFITS